MIINFTNIDRWIAPSHIIYAKDYTVRKEINVDIDDGYSLKFFYGNALTAIDKKPIDRIGHNVYVRIESKKEERNFKELLEEKNGIQDFLNFVITGNNVTAKSIYGISQKNQESLITIKYKSHTDDMNKSKVITPVLFNAHEYQDRLEQILKNWFEFRRSYNTVYRYYVDSIYATEGAVELSYFKLAAFLEGYHRELLEKRGRLKMRRLKDNHFKSIETMLKETEITEDDIKIIKFVLSKNKNSTLAQKLKEIFECYSEIIFISGPVLSFFDNSKLHKWIEKTSVDENSKEKLVKVIDLQIDADSEKLQVNRNYSYYYLSVILACTDNLVAIQTITSLMCCTFRCLLNNVIIANQEMHKTHLLYLLNNNFMDMSTTCVLCG